MQHRRKKLLRKNAADLNPRQDAYSAGDMRGRKKLKFNDTIQPNLEISDSREDQEGDGTHVSPQKYQPCAENSADIKMPESCINENISLVTSDYPTSWTEEMVRYYFEPNEKYKHFDYKEIQKNMDSKPSSWQISDADKFNFGYKKKKGFQLRCKKCNQKGHLKKQCNKYVVCYVCGGFNHSYSECPNTLCFTCGRITKKFLKNCPICRKFLSSRTRCSLCDQIWHEERLCPSKWRKYLSTVQMPGNTILRRSKRQRCYNCTQHGHFGFECSNLLDSDYPPENPFKTAFPNYQPQSDQPHTCDRVIFPTEQTSDLLRTTVGQQFLCNLSKRVNIRIEFFEGKRCYIKLSGEDEIVDYCKTELMKIKVKS